LRHFGLILAMSAVVAAVAAMAADSSAVADSAAKVSLKPVSARVDTVAAVVDTLVSRTLGTPGTSISVDTLMSTAPTPAVAPLSTISTPVDTSSLVTPVPSKTLASADTSSSAKSLKSGKDTAKATPASSPYSSLFTEKVDPAQPAKSAQSVEVPGGDIVDAKEHSVSVSMLVFFAVSLAVIIITLAFFLRKKKKKRFMTDVHLSVLEKVVQQGCFYIESNYANSDLSLAMVCNHLVTGEAYLDALFVQDLGINVTDFIARVRVHNLKGALAAGSALSQDIEAACIQCGFAGRAAAEEHFVRVEKMGIEEYAVASRNG